MKPKAIFIGILLSIVFVFSSNAQQDDFQIEFSTQKDGTVDKLIIVWDDGFRSNVRRRK